jgi:hypothetical protein
MPQVPTVARGEDRPDSDVDLLVDLPSHMAQALSTIRPCGRICLDSPPDVASHARAFTLLNVSRAHPGRDRAAALGHDRRLRGV